MRLHLYLLLLLVFSYSQDRAQQVQWTQTITGSTGPLQKIKVDGDDNLIVCFSGIVSYTSGSAWQMIDQASVCQYDPCGELIWKHLFDTIMPTDMEIDSAGSIYISLVSNTHTGYLVKLSSQGNEQWKRSIAHNYGSSISLDHLGNVYYQYQYTNASGGRNNTCFTQKISSTGQQLWEKPSLGLNAMVAPDCSYYDLADTALTYLVHYDSGGNHLATIDLPDSASSGTFFYDKYSMISYSFSAQSKLQMTWDEDVPGDPSFCEPDEIWVSSFDYDPQTGASTNTRLATFTQQHGFYDPTAGTFTDSCGTLHFLSQNEIFSAADPPFFSNSISSIAACSASDSVTKMISLDWDHNLYFLNSTGRVIGHGQAADIYRGYISSCLINSKGEVILAVRIYHRSCPDTILLVKISADSCRPALTVHNDTLPNRDTFHFENSFRAFPNPFSDQVHFYCIPEGLTNAHLTITDMLGRKVYEGDHDMNENGDNTFLWKAPDNSLKMYFYQIETHNYNYNGKVIRE